ncbi:MAG: hypothetical protein JZD41_07475 [Thermoproteus sp.]|nr:hypothetical protein [Thermoproteus sp.]
MIKIYRDERGENKARIIDLGEVRVISMDVFAEGVAPPQGAEVVEIASRYKVYIAKEDAPGGRIEYVLYDNGSTRQLISVRYIGVLNADEALAYLAEAARRISNIR